MARPPSTSQGRRFHLLLFSFYLALQIDPSNSHALRQSPPPLLPYDSRAACSGLHEQEGYRAKCAFVSFNASCKSKGYIDYLQFFYCTCGRSPVLGYTALLLWLLLLFYLLGNTAACYFCSSLENLSRVLKLSPAIAGVTLLALGNGSPDVFASIVSFLGPGTGEVGINSILGGALFVSCVVVGIISISASRQRISIDKFGFVRDICFLLLAISCLLFVLLVRRINIWGAICFASLYLVYVLAISATHICRRKDRLVCQYGVGRLLPIRDSELGEIAGEPRAPLLGSICKEEIPSKVNGVPANIVGGPNDFNSTALFYLGWTLYVLELPLYFPRRLTIPVVSEERWSKPFAVASVTLAPIFIAGLWCFRKGGVDYKACIIIYACCGSIGVFLGILAYVTTDKSSPPKKFLFPWLAGGFLMSVIWTYIVAEELVGLLVGIGHIIGISPSILALTVLAWGNSIGDLIANVTLALNGGSDGAQVAISGCYAGPIFNMLVGLGLPLLISSWQAYPSSCVVPVNPSLYQTIGFLVGGLLWALMILPRKGMRLDRVLGGGLLAMYLCFLSVRLAYSVGLIEHHGS